MCQIIPKKRTYVPFCALVRVPSRWKVINNPYSTGVYNLYLPAIKHGTWRFSSQWKSWVSISRESSSATSDTGGVMGKFYIPLSIHHDRFTMISPWFHLWKYHCQPPPGSRSLGFSGPWGLLNSRPVPPARQHGAVRRHLSHAHQAAERRDDPGIMASVLDVDADGDGCG